MVETTRVLRGEDSGGNSRCRETYPSLSPSRTATLTQHCLSRIHTASLPCPYNMYPQQHSLTVSISQTKGANDDDRTDHPVVDSIVGDRETDIQPERPTRGRKTYDKSRKGEREKRRERETGHCVEKETSGATGRRHIDWRRGE